MFYKGNIKQFLALRDLSRFNGYKEMKEKRVADIDNFPYLSNPPQVYSVLMTNDEILRIILDLKSPIGMLPIPSSLLSW
jgi:hypothetical protein